MTKKPITVGELRACLSLFPDNAPVIFSWEGVLNPVQLHNILTNPDDLSSTPRGKWPKGTVFLDAEGGYLDQ